MPQNALCAKLKKLFHVMHIYEKSSHKRSSKIQRINAVKCHTCTTEKQAIN